MKLRAIIVDDEEPARQLLAELLGSDPRVEIVAQCGNGFEAVRAVVELKPDLMLLDIQMPKLDGFDVLELVAGAAVPPPAVVFVTGNDAHALRAFEVQAVDYVLKPYSRERLATAIARALDRRASPPPAEALRQTARPGYAPRLAVRDGTRVILIPVAKLAYAQAQDDYVALVADGHTHLKQQTIASLESELDPGEFCRIHRSYIVHLERIARLETQDDRYSVVLDAAAGGVRLPVSRSGLARLRAHLST